MAGEEGDLVPGPAVDVVVEVLCYVDDVERKPAEDEHNQNRHEEAAPPPVPRSLSSSAGHCLAGGRSVREQERTFTCCRSSKKLSGLLYNQNKNKSMMQNVS